MAFCVVTEMTVWEMNKEKEEEHEVTSGGNVREPDRSGASAETVRKISDEKVLRFLKPQEASYQEALGASMLGWSAYSQGITRR